MANYSFFLGQGGGNGGGGDGGYAIIKIEYPSGSRVTVTHGGSTVNAPDTSGVWVYGCEEGGTYTISLAGTTVSKSVSITTKGQIEFVYLSDQVINYGLIYYLGNEFANPSAAESKYAIKTGGYEEIRYISGVVNYSYGAFRTLVNINTSNFTEIFAVGIGESYVDGGIIVNDGTYNSFGTNWLYKKLANNTPSYVIGNRTSVNDLISLGTRLNGAALTQESNHLKWSKINVGEIKIFAVGFVKSDNISGLSAYGSTIDAILTNAVSLFNDTSALQYIALKCTGDFMVAALNNSNFVNTMNTSPNKTILTANEHWNRFIALLALE